MQPERMIDRGSSELASASVTDRGLSDKRPQNEDSFLELLDQGIFAVADGVGGAQAGDVASQMAMEILAEAFRNRGPDSDAESVMRAAIESANGAIFRLSRELPQLESMATTIVALHVADGIATIGHVGDSRLYRVDQHGNLARETQERLADFVNRRTAAAEAKIAQAEIQASAEVRAAAIDAAVRASEGVLRREISGPAAEAFASGCGGDHNPFQAARIPMLSS